MKNKPRDIEGHKKLSFKSVADAGKAYQKVKKLIKKSPDEDGVLVLNGLVLILPASIIFNPANAVEL